MRAGVANGGGGGGGGGVCMCVCMCVCGGVGVLGMRESFGAASFLGL